jgi:predicted cobalt transporter CbtA
MEAHLTKLGGDLELQEKGVAQLPSKGFWLSVTAVQIVVGINVILFEEQLQALLGI